MKKQIKLILVPLYLTSCTTTHIANKAVTDNKEIVSSSSANMNFEFLKLSDCAEENAQRAPSSQASCKRYYESDKTISSEEKAEIVNDVSSMLRGKTVYAEQFGRTENLGLWAMFLGSAKIKQSIQAKIHPVEFLKDNQIKYISKGWRSLKGISDANFKLSKELAEDLNKVLKGDVETSLLQEVNQRFAEENENIKRSISESIRDSIKKYFNVTSGYRKEIDSLDFTENVVSETDFKNIKENFQKVGGYIEESSTSEVNKRSFIAYFPKRKDVADNLGKILSTANSEMQRLKNASYSDQVEFIADLHLKLKVLSPFAKLNDLTIQMLINRCLLQLGIDPAVKVDFDYSMNKQQVADLYRNAINEYIKFTIESYDIKLEENVLVADKEATEILRIGTRIKIYGKYANKYSKAVGIIRTKGSVTPFDEKYIKLGTDQRMFVFKDDGFLYDGIVPHFIRVEQGVTKLYPISDALYKLLSLNGDYNGEVGARRELTPEYIDVLRGNLEGVENVLNKKINPLDVKVIYDAKLIEANKKGELYFYPWQIEIIERASLIKENPLENPYAVLVPNRGDAVDIKRGGSFAFEQNYFRNYKGNKIGDLIGHYEQMDLNYNQLARSIKKSSDISAAKKEKFLSNIHESRVKLHTAARELLRPFLTGISNLNSKELSELRSNANFYILEDYIRNFSKLNYETFDKAIEVMGDDFVYVQRLQSAISVLFSGLWSQTQVKNRLLANFLADNNILVPQLREIYTLMNNPKTKKQFDETSTLSQEVLRKIAEIGRGNKYFEGALEYFVKRVFIKKQQFVQSAAEFESQFITHYLHAINSGNKIGVSTSADPTYLLAVKSYREVSKMMTPEDLQKLFVHYNKVTTKPKEDAQKWLNGLAEREQNKKLSPVYYKIGWLGAFAQDFKLDINDILEVINKKKASSDKFTKQDDGTIYVLRVPVDDIQANHISGTVSSYSQQFENTTNVGYNPIRSLIGVFSRPIIQKNYRNQKLTVDLASMSEKSLAIYDQMLSPLEATADFKSYKKFSETSAEVPKILGNLFDKNQKLYNEAIVDLKGLKYDLQSINTPQAIEEFKKVVEDVFNTTLKVVEYQKDKAKRKELLLALTKFFKNHSAQRGGDFISAWAMELWKTTSATPGFSKDIISKANSEVRAYDKLLKIPDKNNESAEAEL